MKKMLWGLAASALVLSSCSTNEVEDVVSGNDNPNLINFMTSTTKANINDLDALKKDANGFGVYATSGTTPEGWYTNAANATYTYNSTNNNWGWSDANKPVWPLATETAKYPMKFYAMYPKVADATGGEIKKVITVPSPVHANVTENSLLFGKVTTNHIDYLAAQSTADTKPFGGYLALDFKHIMSKINAAIIPGAETKVYVQAVKFHGINTVRTYDYVTTTELSKWMGTNATTTLPMTYLNKGLNTTGLSTGLYEGNNANHKAIEFTGNGTEAKQIYTFTKPAISHKNNLMFVPQNTTAWPTTDGKPTLLPTDGQAYIEVIYRVTDNVNAPNTKNLVGFDQATKAPGYGTPTTTPAYANRPLFVKVGFPLGATWTKGKGYTYNILLGGIDGTGGYYLDDVYYDENGTQTTIKIKDENGDVIIPPVPVNNGTINFKVTVTDWDDAAGHQPGDIK